MKTLKERLPISPFEKDRQAILSILGEGFYNKEHAYKGDDYWLRLKKKCIASYPPEVQELYSLFDSESREDVEYMIGDLKLNYFFNLYGRKTFQFSEHIANELQLTDVNIDTDFIKLPFPVICFHVPAFKMFIYISIYSIGEHRRLKVVLPHIEDTSRISFFSITLINGEKIDYAVKNRITTQGFNESAESGDFNRIVNFIASALLYINSSEADFRDVFPSIFNKKTDSAIPVCAVGRTIVINKDYVSPKGDAEAKEHTIHILKWSVRGHFRNQPCGEGGQERKTIWIRPYLKGKERGNESLKEKPSNLYVVK